MPRTRTASAPSPGQTRGGKKKPIGRPSKIQGWRSTDEEEIERRRQRGATEPLAVEGLEPGHALFGTFRVSSDTGSSYEVEIRSLARHHNSCDCPDFQVNGLGTCKHVEAVLARARPTKGTPADSPRIEVFLRRTGGQPEVRTQWPTGSRRSAAFTLVERFFDPDGKLLGLHSRARMEGMDLPDSEKVPDAWIEERLQAHLSLVRTLRDGSETLLGATDDEVRSWIAAGETFTRELEDGLRRAGAEPASR
jgi:hypothetical protein